MEGRNMATRRTENGKMGAMDNRETEPNRRELRPQIQLFVGVCPLSPFSFSPFRHPSAIPDVSVVSKRLVLVGVWGIKARRKACGQNGPPRRLVAPSRDQGQSADRHNVPPRNLTGPHGSPTGGHYDIKSAFFSSLMPFRSSHVRPLPQ